MRVPLIVAVLMSGVAVPAAAQSDIGRRVDKLERDMQVVQRKVFPGGTVQPEILPQQDLQTAGVPATPAIADLTARVDALETQLRVLTGQTEENAHRLRQLEEGFSRYRADMEERLARQPAVPASEPAVEEPVPATEKPQPSPEPTPNADPGEEAYLVGYRLWNDGKYVEAQKALETMVKKYPKHARATYGQNLLGRAYLDDGKPATAAKVFLSNYQTNPKGERAADSLYFLGQALTTLKKPAEACKVYDELADVYPNMRDWLKQRLPKARQDAKCS